MAGGQQPQIPVIRGRGQTPRGVLHALIVIEAAQFDRDQSHARGLLMAASRIILFDVPGS